MKCTVASIAFIFLFLSCSSREISMIQDIHTNRLRPLSDSIQLHSFYHPCELWEYELSPKRILSVTGDFNGDGKDEKLTEYYYDAKTGKKIDSISADGSIGWQCFYETTTLLICKDTNIGPLKLFGGNDWGILSLINLGDTNGDSIDEISVVMDNADYSSLATCFIFHCCNGVWKEAFSFGIHENAFYYEDDFDTTRFYSEIPDYLVKRNDRWYYYDNDDLWGEGKMTDENGNPEMQPLKISKTCQCL